MRSGHYCVLEQKQLKLLTVITRRRKTRNIIIIREKVIKKTIFKRHWTSGLYTGGEA